MKKFKSSITGLILFLTLIICNSSCKTGSGCDYAHKAGEATSLEELSTKRGKSNLFSKKQRKKQNQRPKRTKKAVEEVEGEGK